MVSGPRRSTATLAEIYNWFTEGFDTVDLKGAKPLLDELTVLMHATAKECDR